MADEKKLEVSQNLNQNQSVETIDSLKVSNTKSQLESLKEDIEHQKKLDLLKNSKLNSLEGFSDFFSYISSIQNSDKLDNIIKILQSDNGENQLSEYFDINSIKGGFGFFTDDTYQDL